MSWLKNWPAPRRLPWLLLISAVVVAADRLTKMWVERHIPLGGAIPVIRHVLRITHWTNEGAAFSMLTTVRGLRVGPSRSVTLPLMPRASRARARSCSGSRLSVTMISPLNTTS